MLMVFISEWGNKNIRSLDFNVSIISNQQYCYISHTPNQLIKKKTKLIIVRVHQYYISAINSYANKKCSYFLASIYNTSDLATCTLIIPSL